MGRKIQSISDSIEFTEKKSRVKPAWREPNLPDSSSRLYVLLNQLKLYCDNSSLVGYKYVTEVQRNLFERVMWLILHLVMAYLLGNLLWNIIQEYMNTPVVTVVESDNYPTNILDSPAVSVCNINRISRRAVDRFAQQIKSSNSSELSSGEISNLLHELGNLYISSFDVHYKNKFEVDEMLKKFFNGNYEITEVMKELSPKCSDIFARCRFRAQNRNCSELFFFRKTQDGFCCTFNYAKEFDDLQLQGGKAVTKNRVLQPYKIEKLGKMNGLTFLMEPHLDDYFFSLLPVKGWKIAIFHPSDYPDNTSGGVTDILISPHTESSIELKAVSFFSEAAVRRHAFERRKCVFADEIPSLFEAYSYSDCLVNCKVNDIFYTCGCRPFYYPRRNTRRVCNTSDAECLHKFKSKWWSVFPHDLAEGEPESELFNLASNKSWSLHCRTCYPTCEDVRYSTQTSSVALEQDNGALFFNDVDIVDQSLVHIFFSKHGTVRLKQDIAYYWYELLSNIGGVCGVFIGFSLVSVVELVYYLVLTGVSLRRSNAEAGAQHVDNAVSLYWDELAPTGLKSRRRKF